MKKWFIGLGKMGGPIAQNILKAGFDLTVYDRVSEKINLLVEQVAQGATSSEKAAPGADVVVSCLLDDQSILEVVTGESGLLAGLKQAGIHIGTTTISPGCAAKLAELHQANYQSLIIDIEKQTAARPTHDKKHADCISFAFDFALT